MADVFISYKRNERPAVEQIALTLRELGLSVWYDASMSAGETFSDEIDREAREAKAILVCWSPAARESRWVRAEAMIGFEQDKLAAAYVSGPDGFSPPTPFNAVHAEDLRAWVSEQALGHAGWKSVLRRIGRLCGRRDIETWGALDQHANAVALRSWVNEHGDSPLFEIVSAVLTSRLDRDTARADQDRIARERFAQQEAVRRAAEPSRPPQTRYQAARESQPVTGGVVRIIQIVLVVVLVIAGAGYFLTPSVASRSQTLNVERPYSTVLARLASTPMGSTVAEGVIITETASVDGDTVTAPVTYADGATGRVVYRVAPDSEGSRVQVRLEQDLGTSPLARFAVLTGGDVAPLIEPAAAAVSADLGALPNAGFEGLQYSIVDIASRPFFFVQNCSVASAESITSIISQAVVAIPVVMNQNRLTRNGPLMAVEPNVVSGQYCYQVGYPFTGRAPRALLIGQIGQTPSGQALRIVYTGSDANVLEVYARMDALLAAARIDDPATTEDDWTTFEVYHDDPTQAGGSRNREIYYVVQGDISAIRRLLPPTGAVSLE